MIVFVLANAKLVISNIYKWIARREAQMLDNIILLTQSDSNGLNPFK